jgi:ParB family chromosome partitioning protein
VGYYTPSDVVEAARVTLGWFDLDPASCADANETVRAGLYYTKEDNGLMLPWFGRVWMNHPFTKGRNHLWINKLVESYQCGDVEAACCITWASMPESWMRPLLQFPQCFPHKRIQYTDSRTGQPMKAAPKGSVITYLGPDVQRFAESFRHIGTVKIAI